MEFYNSFLKPGKSQNSGLTAGKSGKVVVNQQAFYERKAMQMQFACHLE